MRLTSWLFWLPLPSKCHSPFEGLYTDGITQLEPQDVAYKELGYAIKHLGIARQSEQGVELRVHPTLVPQASMIAGVNDVANAVMVNADAVGSTLFCGPGVEQSQPHLQ